MFVQSRNYISIAICLLFCAEALCNISSFPDKSNDIFKTFNFFSSDLKCGQTSRLRKLTIRNPAKQVTDCTYTIKPLTPRVCQLRIDFDTVLAQPSTGDAKGYPTCVNDKLIVKNYEFCGTNVNQHIYVPFNVQKMTESIKITFKTANRMDHASLGAIIWTGTITQIDCPDKAFISQYDKLLAPEGCLQYFTDDNGTIESFNYNQGEGPYLGNSSYAICIRRKSHEDKLNLKAVSFEMSQAAPTGEGMDTDCVPQVPTEGGSEDHLSISEAVRVNANTMRGSKFCGKSLSNSAVSVSAPGPFVMHFFSDVHYDSATKVEKGFKFNYNLS